MVRWAFLFIFCCASFFLAPVTGYTVYAQEQPATYILADLNYEPYGDDFGTVILASNKIIDVVYYEIEDPYRIVIDLVGVAFCELEQQTSYDKGSVRRIEIIRDRTAKRPAGLDDFFYAVDYIIIEPVSKMPYKVSFTERGRVVAVDIGEKREVKTIKAEDIESVEDEFIKEKKEKEPPAQAQEAISQIQPEGHGQPQRPTYMPKQAPPEKIIDYLQCEALEDASLVVISSSADMQLQAEKRHHPKRGILIRPGDKVFTNLEEEARIDNGYIRSISIAEDDTLKKPQTLDEYFYPVRNIFVETEGDLEYDFYSNGDGTISILEIIYPEIRRPVKIAEAEPGREAGEAKEPEEELFTRSEVLQELKEDIRQEGLLREEPMEGLTRQAQESRRLKAERLTDEIGREVLEDLIVKGKGVLQLAAAQDIALKNSPEAKTARDELSLARLKKKEAFRALFPQVKIKGSKTEGDVLGVDFIEEVYGVQAEQPLYQGGRLWNTYKQSKVNLKVAKTRQLKIENDINYRVAEAYYDTVTTSMNLRLQKELLNKTGVILRQAEERYKSGLSTKLEILNVRSAYNQINFQIAVAERDLALARFKLQQAMNIDIKDEGIDLADVEPELGFKVLEVDLQKCLDMASENQPDILVNSLLVESNRYNEKIAKAKKRLKVDITGFYGKSGSHYESESRDLSNDWNIGIRFSKPLWGHNASYSYTKEETSRKVGQTDRTGSVVNAGEISFFDKEVVGVEAEIKESRVNRQRAENDLIEARRQAALEVKEAYYSYQQSIIQVKNALEKVQFQEEAVKVAEAQAELNEALQSQLLESVIKLADEKSVYVKALSDYNLSLSKLNKAVGIRDFFSLYKEV